MPVVHGALLSPFVRKLRAALFEKGIEHEVRFVNPFRPKPEFRRLSPLGKIPVLQEDDGFAVADSSVILAYLERTRPEPALYPADPRALAQALFIEELADTTLGVALGTPFSERLMKPRFLGAEPDEALVRRELQETLPPLLDWLEAFEPDGVGIVAGRFSVADLALASPFVNLHYAGEAIDPARWPKLDAHVRAILARPAYARVLAEEPALT